MTKATGIHLERMESKVEALSIAPRLTFRKAASTPPEEAVEARERRVAMLFLQLIVVCENGGTA